MNRQKGFTIIELLVVFAILGVLTATAIPLYRTFQQRAYGSEAITMLKQILDAEVIYFLEKENFFPGTIGDTIIIAHNDSPEKPEINMVKDALNLIIPIRHFLDFTISRLPNSCLVTISSPQNSFPLFKDGSPSITASVDITGKIILY